MRGLGVPTVIDRVVQQAITDVLSLEYEPTFSDRSYGFRPKRSTHMALLKAKELANTGYTWTLETDLAKFFDTVPHQRLIGKLSQCIQDGQVISLIHRIMRAEVSDKGELTRPRWACRREDLSPRCWRTSISTNSTKCSKEGGIKSSATRTT